MLIGYWQNVEGDFARTAEAYDVPLQAIEAALAYYEKHRSAIDARLAANDAAFAA
ncbi:MAG: hypothetical protein HY331_17145 [Chloroflexi bacterium]|nr:hypothetical protein [Chloroflexota bacterium]